ncbi:interferon-stimulated 20 kda [Lynx pardinus]|uniref:Interferon-stimulated 20 kDa n=1 Tax=Lynx pardinus TaxID=191816 RepID=A0A485P8I6_LYNPA|nr:interferon-stimulated 20 kda [Lynx pardinus]
MSRVSTWRKGPRRTHGHVGLVGCRGFAASSPAPPLFLFQILKILAGKIVVGHAIHNDFKALQYSHPKSLTRDTSHIPPLNRKAECPENATVSLKCLTKKLLNRDIQVGKSGHSSVEDAQATMELYKLVEVEWEQHLAQNPPKD